MPQLNLKEQCIKMISISTAVKKGVGELRDSVEVKTFQCVAACGGISFSLILISASVVV